MSQSVFFWRILSLRLLLPSCLMFAALSVHAEKNVNQYIVNQVASPAHVAWQKQSQTLHGAAKQFCGSEKSSLAALRTQWLVTQHAWAALQPVLLAPDAGLNLGMQVQFWPDKRNLVAKQVEEQLKKNPAISAKELTAGSVALQGLTASEYILFDKGHDLADAAVRARYCPLLQANTTYQLALSLHLLQAWQEQFVASLLQVPNKQFADAQVVQAALLRVHVAALGMMKKKLGTALGVLGNGTPQPYQAEAWRAQDSLGSLAAGIGGSRLLWDGEGLRVPVMAAAPELAVSVDEAYNAVQASLNANHQPLDALLASAQGVAQAKSLYAQLETLHRLYESDIAKALNVQLGFNSADGD